MNRVAKTENPIQVQRTNYDYGNTVRIKNGKALTVYDELVLEIKGEKIGYIPYNAFKELLQAFKDGQPVLDYMLIFF